MKKIISLVLAITVVLVLSVLSFAETDARDTVSFFSNLTAEEYKIQNGDAAGETIYFGEMLSVYEEDETQNGAESRWLMSFNDGENKVYFYMNNSDKERMTAISEKLFTSDKAEHLTAEKKAKVTDEVGVNLRYGPAVGFKIIDMVPTAAEVTYEYKYGDWALVEYGGNKGWMNLKYTEDIPVEVKPVENPEPIVTEPKEEVVEVEEHNNYLTEFLFHTGEGIIVFICLVAAALLIVAAIVLVIILLAKKHKDKQKETKDIY